MIDREKLYGMSENKIYELINQTLKGINFINENKLYKEEQLYENSIKIKNCVAWEIRINHLIEEILYALNNSCIFAQKMVNPIDKTEEKKLYEYYLTDAVLRLITLWDIYKQLINEFYEVGFKFEDNFSIFTLLKKIKKESKWESVKLKVLSNYLNSDEHKAVREKLRNVYVHSFDSTNQYILHEINVEGLIKPNFDLFTPPKYQIENIIDVTNDFKKLLEFIREENAIIKGYIKQKIMVVSFDFVASCGKRKSGRANIAELLDCTENCMMICNDNPDCEHLKEDKGNHICKPRRIIYSRINEPDEKIEIYLHKAFEDMGDEIVGNLEVFDGQV